MAEKGWGTTLLMWLNGALIAGLFTSGTIYFTHLKWSAEKASQIDSALTESSGDRANIRFDVSQMRTNQELMRQSIVALTRAVDRLADSNCYRDTGKPCSRAFMDDRP